MSLPRQVLPGTTYLVTRRVAQRQFLLTPNGLINEVVSYCLHRAAKIYGVDLHAVQVLSNHLHIILTDIQGELPRFMAWLDREIAKALNKHYERTESFWSNDHYSAVVLHDAESVIAKLVYLFTNVVRAGLVRSYREWPGVASAPRDWLMSSSTVSRPPLHFNQRETQWAEVPAHFSAPPALRDRDLDQLVRDIEALIADDESHLAEVARHERRTFRGGDRCLGQSPFDAPTTKRIKGRLNPTFAAGTAEGQKRARAMLQYFRAAYREARDAFRRGAACLFPAGTYWLPRIAQVCCAPLETATPALTAA